MNVYHQQPTDESAVHSGIERYLREANEKLRLAEHEKRSKIIELQCELEYERKRADEIESKFKKEMTSNSSDARIQQLTYQLSKKENEILEIRAKYIEKKRGLAVRIEEQRVELAKIPKLEQTIKGLEGEVGGLKEQLERVKEGAVEAILEKQGLIASLEEELKIRSANQHTTEFLELKYKYDELADRFETESKAYEARLYLRRQEINKLNERMESDQQQFEYRLIRLEGEINQKMERNLDETLNSARVQESSLLQSMESLQEKLHRSEAKVLYLQTELYRRKLQSYTERRKLEDQKHELLSKYTSEMATSNREMELLTKAKDKEMSELHQCIEKLKDGQLELQKKLYHLETKGYGDAAVNNRAEIIENLRKLSKASFSDKSDYGERQAPVGLTSEIEDIRALEDSSNFKYDDWVTSNPKTTEEPAAEQPTIQQQTIQSQQPNQSAFQPAQNIEYHAEYIQLQQDNSRLKKELQEAEHTLESNSSEIARITKELQAERQSVLALTNKRSELVVELESLRSHTFKVESTLLTEKLKHAEYLDFVKENFMVERKEFTIKLIKLNEEKGDMLIELDKLRKKVGPLPPTSSPLKFIKKP